MSLFCGTFDYERVFVPFYLSIIYFPNLLFPIVIISYHFAKLKLINECFCY